MSEYDLGSILSVYRIDNVERELARKIVVMRVDVAALKTAYDTAALAYKVRLTEYERLLSAHYNLLHEWEIKPVREWTSQDVDAVLSAVRKALS